MSKAFDEFPLSISAYLADTQHLSTVQHGAYLLLLMTMRRAGGYLPDDDRKLANIVKLTLAKWQRIGPDIRALLTAQDGKLTQKRVKSDIETQMVLSQKNASNGKTGGLAKSLKNKEPTLAIATPSPADRHGAEVNAIPSLVKDSEKEDSKKVSGSRGTALPGDWVASPADRAYGAKLGLTEKQVEACGEDMRLWAKANANRAVGRKADWSATFHGWMRREAPKLNRRNGGGSNGQVADAKLGFSGIAARIRQRLAHEDDGLFGPVPEDLEPVNGR